MSVEKITQSLPPPQLAQKINEIIDEKVDVVDGKGLSTNDLTNELKTNYDSAYTHSTTPHAPSDAEKNVNPDWNATSGETQILNKPELGSAALKDAPPSGNASSTQVVLGNDTRLTDARTANGGTSDSVKETNNNSAQKFWSGTQTEFNAITTKDEDTLYIITDEEPDDDVIIDGNTQTAYNGLLKGNGTNVVQAEAGTDYVAPDGTKVLSDNNYTTAEKNKLASVNASIVTASSVSVTTWEPDSTYTDYPYRASVAVTGMTAGHYPEVVYSVADASSGNYAPVCESYNGGVYIWSKVNTGMTLDSILGLKKVN